jgi:hypothetical protein
MGAVMSRPDAAEFPAQRQSAPDAAAEWGELATVAKAAGGSLGPLWKKFIKTKFFTSILRSPDDDPKNFLLNTFQDARSGKLTLIMSESRERLDPQQGNGIVALSGADIVCRIEDNSCIEILLPEGAYTISKKRVEWLRIGIEGTKKRIVYRKQLAAAAPAAPLPVLQVGGASVAVADDDDDEELESPATARALLTTMPALAMRYAGPAGLAVVALGVLAAITIPFGSGADEEMAPAVAQATVPTQAAAVSNGPLPPPGPGSMSNEPSIPFAPMDNSFIVNLPGRAEEVELSPEHVARLGDVRTHQYKLQYEDRMYIIEATDYMDRAPQDPTVEYGTIQQSIVGNDGSLIRSNMVGLGAGSGREVRVRLADGGERAARFAFIGSRFCLVMVTVPDGQKAAAQIDAFLNSFLLN